MKKISILILALSVSIGCFAKNLTAYFYSASFKTPTDGPYVETYLNVIGSTVNYIASKTGAYQGMIEVSIAFSQDGEIKNFKKYNLLSPEIKDTLNGLMNFIDQQRFFLPNGTYDLELQIKDKNSSSKPFLSKQKVEVNYQDNEISISDIQFLESMVKASNPTVLTKSGYDLLPYISNFFPENSKKLSFYAEAYNLNKHIPAGNKFLVNYFIEGYESNTKLTDYSRFSKEDPQEVQVIHGEFAIDQLPSGNYNLVVEIRNNKNELLSSKKTFIQRKNQQVVNAEIQFNNSFASKLNDKDSLSEYILSLRPISSQMEIGFADNQLKSADLELMQKYFHSFWIKRNPNNPEQQWLTYNEEVKKVQKMFGAMAFKGYRTDRGRVYLQYGPPDSRAVFDREPSAYPHEIWQYYKTNLRTNRKFVFYNAELASNNYRLLHSDAPGEIMDARWEHKLHSRNNPNKSMDNETSPEHFGGKASENYRDPY